MNNLTLSRNFILLDGMEVCCRLGNETDPSQRNCYRRAMEFDFGFLNDKDLILECKARYLNCCITAFGLEGMNVIYN